jgi:glutamate synthase domain-containing protein 3
MLERNRSLNRERIRTSPLAASKRFGRYKGESEKAQREHDVQTNLAGVERLLGFWRENLWQMDIFSVRSDYAESQYDYLSGQARNLEYTAQDVQRFSIVLPDHQDENNFLYKVSGCLSVLVNSGPQTRYVINTDHLGLTPEYLGWRNNKDLTVLGQAGHHFGRGMEAGDVLVQGCAGGSLGAGMGAGTIMVEGDAADAAGIHLKGGLIHVKGDVTRYAAMYMKGGKLAIDGDAGPDLGCFMEGGIVHVKGDVGSISRDMKGGEVHVDGEIGIIGDIRSGRIYHRGRLIVDK